MIIYMCDIICVTNRRLCPDDFRMRIKQIADTDVSGIILREKDLSMQQYEQLAHGIMPYAGEKLIIHSFELAAQKTDCKSIHMPMHILRQFGDKSYFEKIGASCHSVAEAKEAESLGCTYITAGHIFDTDCKKGLPGRGLRFLRDVCENVNIPVYAIGGITKDNISDVLEAGASGVCVMSSLMTCSDPKEYISQLRGVVK